jgi:hypothetical protein
MGAIKTMKEVESALPQKKEINYVRALDKNGNPILINKEDLAQVVGELFTSLGLFPFMQRDIIQGEMSPDDIRTSGMYDVGNSTTMPFNYGGLLVFNTKTLTIQTGVDLQGKTICIRVSWNNGPWSSWNNFTFNQQSI